MAAFYQELVEVQTADADPSAALEGSRRMAMTGEESDAFEGSAVAHSDSERGQIFARIRHEALTAGLVDGRMKGVGDDNIETFLPQCDCGRESCWTTTDDECVTV